MNNLSKSPWMIIVIGVISIGFSFFSYTKQSKMIENGIETTGVVIDVKIDKSRKKSTRNKKNKKYGRKNKENSSYNTTYLPVIEFFTKDSTRYEFKSISGSTNFDTYKVGNNVAILYEPANPQSAQLKSKVNMTTTYGAAAGGLLALIIGIIAIIMKKKKLNIPGV